MSLLNPTIVTPQVLPLIGLVPVRGSLLYYEWTIEEQRIADDSLALVGDTFEQCFAQLVERHPCPPGTARVFSLQSYLDYKFRTHSTLNDYWSDFAAANPRLDFSSNSSPYNAAVVVYPTPVITTHDPLVIQELLAKYGTMPHAHGKRDQPFLEDPMSRIQRAKSTYAPGSLGQYIYDPSGRIAARRLHRKSIKECTHIPFDELLRDEHDDFVHHFTAVFKPFCKRLEHRVNPLVSPLRNPRYANPRWGHNVYSFDDINSYRLDTFLLLPKMRVSEIAPHFSSLVDDLDKHSFLLLTLCKQSPQLRTALLTYLLTITNHTSTLCYLVCEAYVSRPDDEYTRARQSILKGCFAVARLTRSLHPTPQEIRNVRDQHDPFDPDPYLAALRKRGQ